MSQLRPSVYRIIFLKSIMHRKGLADQHDLDLINGRGEIIRTKGELYAHSRYACLRIEVGQAFLPLLYYAKGDHRRHTLKLVVAAKSLRGFITKQLYSYMTGCVAVI